MVNGALVALLKPDAVAVSVYPLPARSMLRFEKVAIPFTAATVFVPDRIPPLGFAPKAILIESVKLVTVLPESSCAATRTAGEIGLPAVAPLGWTVNASRVADDGGGGCAAAALSATTVASQVRGEPGESKNHVHCGSTEPAVARRAYSPSAFIDASPMVVTLLKPAGRPRPTTPFDI